MRLHAEVTTADTAYGMILLHERNGRYWQLNHTGTLILRTLLAGESPRQAADRLIERYDVGLPQAEHDVRALIDGLVAAGLAQP
ncbi:lasso peptide biosynthesis PqqD family chaperone [Nonomuraea sp. H19]|uniref:lasso peptide biosynthesis PqqD family chaperone n=1 Tax=Nonomuraea sp. H19 TaxID=3452206 RepID=UPI003F8A0D30